MKIQTYRIIDVAILSAVACLLEAVNMLTFRLLNEIFVLSIALAMSVIVMSRWGWWAVITSVLAGISYCLTMRVQGELYLIYALGNAFIAFNLFWFKLKKGKEIFDSTFYTVLFVITAFILMSLGKSLTALIFKIDFFPTLLKFITTDALNLVIGIIIVLIARRQDGLMENQFDYIKKISPKKPTKTHNEEES